MPFANSGGTEGGIQLGEKKNDLTNTDFTIL